MRKMSMKKKMMRTFFLSVHYDSDVDYESKENDNDDEETIGIL